MIEDNRRLETLLARHCAPVLFGKKPAALLAGRAVFEGYRRDDLSECLSGYGMSVLRLTSGHRPLLFLLYRPELLARTLAQPCVRQTLRTFGYPDARASDWEPLLKTLLRRFAESEDFPHEVGLFLGYPVADVLGFIACKGKDCKFCGTWKVYENVEEAKRRFAEFAYLRGILSDFVQSGGSIRKLGQKMGRKGWGCCPIPASPYAPYIKTIMKEVR
jgi:hypothetical protein